MSWRVLHKHPSCGPITHIGWILDDGKALLAIAETLESLGYIVSSDDGLRVLRSAMTDTYEIHFGRWDNEEKAQAPHPALVDWCHHLACALSAR